MSQVLFARGVAITGLPFVLINRTDGTGITTGTVTCYITKDGGTQAASTNSPTHKGNGQWSINLTASERDAKITGLLITHASAVPLNIAIISDDQLGAGAIEWTLNAASGASGADVWITYPNDDTVVAAGTLDVNGDITVYLDAGTYWAYFQKVGLTFSNPLVFTVA